MNPRISVITVSIRPPGVEVVRETLKNQTFKDFEHIVRLSEPGPVPDLCKSLNSAIREAKGTLLVFIQDYIQVEPDALQRCWDKYLEDPEVGWTSPVGKIDDLNDKSTPRWEWRKERALDSFCAWYEFEIDFAWIPRHGILSIGGFDEEFDSGFSWENVSLGYRLFKEGWGFKVDPKNLAYAWDHDKFLPHPYRHKPNLDLWTGKKYEIDQGRVKLPYLD